MPTPLRLETLSATSIFRTTPQKRPNLWHFDNIILCNSGSKTHFPIILGFSAKIGFAEMAGQSLGELRAIYHPLLDHPFLQARPIEREVASHKVTWPRRIGTHKSTLRAGVVLHSGYNTTRLAFFRVYSGVFLCTINSQACVYSPRGLIPDTTFPVPFRSGCGGELARFHPQSL